MPFDADRGGGDGNDSGGPTVVDEGARDVGMTAGGRHQRQEGET
jgi:hypothetical protein